MRGPEDDAILTLEPLIEAVRDGVGGSGWELSGLQKTTSHQFEGRWAGDSTRSAYLFFHLPTGPEWASLDVFLDETSQGLSGNLALVVECRPLGEQGAVVAALEELATLTRATLPQEYRTPITVRFRLERPDTEAASAQTEVRFKVRIPRSCIGAGAPAVTDMAAAAAKALVGLLVDPRLAPFLDLG